MPDITHLHAHNFPLTNRILAALPSDEYQRLRSHLKPIRLSRGKLLWEAGDHIRHAYFPQSGIISLLATTESGSTIEIAMVGNEGLAGVAAVMKFRHAPYKVVARFPSAALRIGIDMLDREFRRCGRLQELLLRFTHTLITQIAQSASCGRFHTTEQRLCRWLLICRDRMGTDTLPLTQEVLSQMIGCPRTSVSTIAGKIQKMGLIGYSRSRVRILDPKGLAAYSCECYRLVNREINRLFAA